MALYHLVNTLTNDAGDALVGYYVRLVSRTTGLVATLYADSDGTIAIDAVSGAVNAAKTDNTGVYSIYVEDGSYDIQIYDKNNINTLLRIIEDVPMFGGATAAAAAADAAAAAASATAAEGFADDAAASAAAAAVSAAEALDGKPNGTLGKWLQFVDAAGGTASANAKTAYEYVESALRDTGLISKIEWLSLFLGDDVATARIPFITRTGYTSMTGTFASFTQADGLSGITALDTGVRPDRAGLGDRNCGFGIYSLSQAATGLTATTSQVLGEPTAAGIDYWGLRVGFSTYSVLLDTWLGGVGRSSVYLLKLNGSTDTYPTLGSISAHRDSSGRATFMRNGLVLDQNYADTAAGPDRPSTTMKVISTSFDLGGAWLTEALTIDEQAALHSIVHEANRIVGRSVTAEGLA